MFCAEKWYVKINPACMVLLLVSWTAFDFRSWSSRVRTLARRASTSLAINWYLTSASIEKGPEVVLEEVEVEKEQMLIILNHQH